MSVADGAPVMWNKAEYTEIVTFNRTSIVSYFSYENYRFAISYNL